ncbi:Very-long-chain 3-oxoacyl-CoA reductase 1 [Porphyridium purpureum]|uniref:Very-long-chain 3-oxoacyl-CoA reductase 1 n=1 Tax=Porphyridium purpureum TaxID=35688 RepID=A0A5J4YRE6_PORPP|nr:Very-long-chain 3-oxoacyl-CoA reductase 1 [Porphyridium purpureum]|eukprot:POR6786..scf236_6
METRARWVRARGLDAETQLERTMWQYVGYVAILLCAVLMGTQLVPAMVLAMLPGQNLKRKYGAHWALVTGASSGIGLALARKLAQQELNVVLVALDDEMLHAACSALKQQYPKQQFRAVGANLSAANAAEYMDKIKQATADIAVSIVMSNAGYLLMGFFEQRPVEQHIANAMCNALCPVHLAHYFVRHMKDRKIKGCIAFTSSAAYFLPTPFASMYGAGKAFLSEFAMSLAVETRDHAIDVFAIHPSYTRTNLYANTEKLGVLAFLDKFAATPEDVADALIHSVGRVICLDYGWYAKLTRLVPKIFDISLLAQIIIPFRTMIPEYKQFATASGSS